MQALHTETYLESAFTQELVPSAKRDLDDSGEFGHLSGHIVLNVCDALNDTSSFVG